MPGKVPKKYLSDAKNPAAKRREILETRRRYKKGLPIDIAKVSKFRASQAKKSASAKKPSGKPLSAAAEAFIQKKAAGSRFTPGQLRSVYRRGQGAFFKLGEQKRVDGRLVARPRQQLRQR